MPFLKADTIELGVRNAATPGAADPIEFGYAIAYNNMGYRCGYLLIPNDHPWYEKGICLAQIQIKPRA